jgi:hypothetical protein
VLLLPARIGAQRMGGADWVQWRWLRLGWCGPHRPARVGAELIVQLGFADGERTASRSRAGALILGGINGLVDAVRHVSNSQGVLTYPLITGLHP